MLLGLAANLWATSDGILQKVKEDLNPGINKCETIRVHIADVRRNWVEINEMNKWSK